MDNPLPLAGVRVADFTRVLTGPFCTQTLGDLGADVLKIEPPQGDDTRAWGPPYLEHNGPKGAAREATYFLSANRNKRSVVLDLKTPEGLQAARDLIATCDVVVENYRPGTLEKLGLGAADLMQQDPRLVLCSITGFGATGPLSDWAGYDIIAQGMSGFMAYTGQADAPPTKAGVAVADIFAGALATQGILAALYEREKTGRGRRVEVNLLEAMLALGTYQVGRFLGAGEDPERLGNEHRSIMPYGTYSTQDGFINIAGGNDALYQKLCQALNAPDLQDQRFATNAQRVAQREELTALLEAQLQRLSSSAAIDVLQSAGVPCGPVWSVRQALQSEFVAARGVVVATAHDTLGEVRVTAPPFEFDGVRLPVRFAPPRLGEHQDAVMQELTSFKKP